MLSDRNSNTPKVLPLIFTVMLFSGTLCSTVTYVTGAAKNTARNATLGTNTTGITPPSKIMLLTALTTKGIALLNSGKINEVNESIAYFDRALAINPNDANALTQKGLAVGRLGEYNESIAYFDRALAINPKFVGAIKEKAASVAAAAAAANATALTNKAIAMLSLGKYNESISYFDKALAIQPANSFALAGKKLDLVALSKTSILAAPQTSTGAQAIPPSSTFGYYFKPRTTNATATPPTNAHKLH
jgi:hypothetical protein